MRDKHKPELMSQSEWEELGTKLNKLTRSETGKLEEALQRLSPEGKVKLLRKASEAAVKRHKKKEQKTASSFKATKQGEEIMEERCND